MARLREAWNDVAYPLGVFLASRVLVVAAAVVGHVLRPLDIPKPWPAIDLPHAAVVQALSFWDGSWYASIAAHGYPTRFEDNEFITGRIAFFPLYPAMVRGGARLTGLPEITVGILLSTLFGALAAVLVHRLTRELSDEVVARRTTALFCFFPASFVFSMAYAESVMIAAAAACLWALIRRRWWIAGLAAAIATASRPNAIVLVGCCAWAAFFAIRERKDWRALVAPALAPIGTLAYFAFLEIHTGSVTAWFTVQEKVWKETVDFGAPFQRFEDVFRTAVATPGTNFAKDADMNTLVPMLGLLVVIIGFIGLWRWRPPAVVVLYALGVVAAAVISKTLGTRPRFVLTAFPVVMGIAYLGRRASFQWVIGGSAGLLALLTVLTISTAAVTP